MKPNSDLDHCLQLRVAKTTIATIDGVIATTPELASFNRCRFIREAVAFTLASIIGKVHATHTEKQQ